ncbi:hypothetical protein [Tardiphaga sp. P5_C10]
MKDEDDLGPDASRRYTLALAAGVAALGLALGMRSAAFAQGESEEKWEGRVDGKLFGKEGRRNGKPGRIRVEMDNAGTTSVDVKCADDESMRDCADLTRDIVDRIKGVAKP